MWRKLTRRQSGAGGVKHIATVIRMKSRRECALNSAGRNEGTETGRDTEKGTRGERGEGERRAR